MNGPIIELSLYARGRAEADVFESLVVELLDGGASFAGTFEAFDGPPDTRETYRFCSLSDDPLPRQVTATSAELLCALRDPSRKVVEVELRNAVFRRLERNIATYVGISERARDRDTHPLAVWTSSDFFEFAEDWTLEAEMVCSTFLRLVAAIRPTYATITFEQDLQCLTDLRRDPEETTAFVDFFIDREFAGARMQDIARLFSRGYRLDMEAGTYFSGSPELNPSRVGIPAERAHEISRAVARLLASDCR